tara:strand:+ start:369 stop:842 length:474 start_codon:yes stop_codon:yes gene_type:complete
MELKLKNISYYKQGSEETPCYNAIVYINNEKAIEVSNDGHGGCDRQYPIKPFTYKDIEEVKNYLAKKSGDDFEPLDTWCHKKMYDDVDKKRLKRHMNVKFICFDKIDNEIYAFHKGGLSSLQFETFLEKKYPNYTCLNFLSFNEAWKLFDEVTRDEV